LDVTDLLCSLLLFGMVTPYLPSSHNHRRRLPILLKIGFLLMMGENKLMGKRWEDMDTDVLVKIFKELNLVELSPVSQVCRLWRLACSDPLIWGTLDFGLLKSNFIQTRASPYIWVDDRSDRRLARILRVAMAISCGNVNCMIFHYNLFMKDEHLHFISE
ncbi:hypothetical protein ACJX0J_009077, partial [Zea mays]